MTEETQPSIRFADLNLSAELLQVLERLGFEHPTPIQEAAIPILQEGRDVVGIAQTGTGKTAAFGLPMLERITSDHHVQALVLAPTRELALQTASALEQFSADSAISIVSVYGGSPYGPQLRALREGAQIVVGTPGRVIDLIDKKALKLEGVRMLVLDEADEMLRMGFAEDVETITASIPEGKLTALFSATMPKAIERVAANHLNDPVRVEVSSPATTVDTIHQTFAVVPSRYRFEALTRVLATRAEGGTIVFVRTRQDAEDISLDLAAAGFKAAGISGDVPQRDRERLVERLRSGALDVLVATDVAARGLDVERISLVVNYEVPRETEAYVHRVGRTGRAGRDGESLTFFGPKERFRLRQIERLTGTPMDEIRIPSADDVVRFVAARKIAAFSGPIPAESILRSVLDDAAREGHGLEEIALRLLANAAGAAITEGSDKPSFAGETDSRGRFIASEFDGPGKRKGKEKGRRKSEASRPRPEGSFSHRYRVEVGKRDGVRPGAIVGAITNEGGLKGDALGKIDIFPSFSLVEMSERLSPSQVKRISRATIQGRRLRISTDSGATPRKRGGSDQRGKKRR